MTTVRPLGPGGSIITYIPFWRSSNWNSYCNDLASFIVVKCEIIPRMFRLDFVAYVLKSGNLFHDKYGKNVGQHASISKNVKEFIGRNGIWMTVSSFGRVRHLVMRKEFQWSTRPATLLILSLDFEKWGRTACVNIVITIRLVDQETFRMFLQFVRGIKAHKSDFSYVKCNYIWHINIIKAWYVHSNGKQWL